MHIGLPFFYLIRPESEFDLLKSIGIPFSGFDRSDRWIWFHRIRDFRSTGGIFGLPILVWVALLGLFSDVVSMVDFGVYCALAMILINVFKEIF